ncbi:ATP-binding protein [Actinomadura violacea]|uniref:ATP-binding protein n=1 Tax=Actinomadura violacea TaxID=2819934 RepID=A0ABS3SA21_9ACTN|nr:ATP-binding protein [Actinomadura violacea]MBO2465070.1 ATP-binding protein [Actinomadura violacea]
MSIGHAAEIALGGMCAWRLPVDATCASVSRSLLAIALTDLRLEREAIDDITLAASELVTNALNHGLRPDPLRLSVPPELWLWARVTPSPQLVVSVFDACRDSFPDTTPRELLDEHGKGLGIVGILAAAWGAHRSRSRLGAGHPGKAVWCAFPLNAPWPNPNLTAPPVLAAQHLAATLAAQGIRNVQHRQGRGVSLVTVPTSCTEINVWVEPAHLTCTTSDGSRIRRPMADLHDIAEHLVSSCEN